MKARPAWNTVFTPLNFMLEYVSAGCLGACFFATAFGQPIPLAFLLDPVERVLPFSSGGEYRAAYPSAPL